MTIATSVKLTDAEAEAAIASFRRIISYPTVSSTAPSTGGEYKTRLPPHPNQSLLLVTFFVLA